MTVEGGRTAASVGERSAAETTVVSLAPSATATLAALGAGERIEGVTAHCALDRPVVGGWLNPDYDRLADLGPDLVCTADGLQAEIRDDLRDRGYDVCHVEPDTLDAVIDSFETLGDAVGLREAGSALAVDARERIDAVRRRVEAAVETDGRERPVVYCEEWGDPPMAAGNWVPDAVAAAGGRYPFCEPGARSREVTRERVERADPDHVVVHHCGRGDRVDSDLLTERGWELDASIHVLDDDLLNQPSPALGDGIETLAALLYGDG
ncbi:helical backbone metal receptor [Halobellus salinisoli]|uniref:helical backbone metal receptor n=1 Tax=Halobellus salinisoli TaxID=3108500 RepID=UPI00300941AE